jgi:hypothetical protein
MPGPGEYRPDPSEGITRIEDLPKPKIRRLGDRRVGELRLVGLPAHRQDVPRRHRQHQPQSLHSIRHRHPRRLPLPAAALQQLVAPFDPRPHPVPQRLRLVRCQVGEQEPRLVVALLLASHQPCDEKTTTVVI